MLGFLWFSEGKHNMLIPFVVLQELDQLKRRNGHDDSVSSKASRAIRYIYDELKSKNPRLQGNIVNSFPHWIRMLDIQAVAISICLSLLLRFTMFIGQKAMEDKSHVIDVSSPDDKVLNCCLQLKNQSKEIILVTNDKNLASKALLNGIEAITSRECLERF